LACRGNEIREGHTDQLEEKPIEMSFIALRNTVYLLQAGLRTYERKNLNLRLPMRLHSGVMQIFNSFTVAGAVLALPESDQSAPASRLTFMTNIVKAPEARRRRLQKGLMRVKFCELRCGEQVNCPSL
jgi:hypothetical protein